MGSSQSTTQDSASEFGFDNEIRFSISTQGEKKTDHRCEEEIEQESVRQLTRFGRNRSVSKELYTFLDQITKRNWKEVQTYVFLYPEDLALSLRMKMYGIERKLTPFHLLCAFDPPSSLLERILSYPPTENCVMTPMMNSSSSSSKNLSTGLDNQDEDTLSLIVDEYNMASYSEPMRETDNLLPLHIATLYGASSSVISTLLTHYPSAAKYKNGMGMLPIHIVCAGMRLEPPKSSVSLGASASYVPGDIVEAVHLLLKAFPDSIHVPCSSLFKRSHKTPAQYVNDCLLPMIQDDQAGLHCTKDQVDKILVLLNSNVKDDEDEIFVESTVRKLSALNGKYASTGDIERRRRRRSSNQSFIISDSSNSLQLTRPSSQFSFMKKRKNKSPTSQKLYNFIIERKWDKAMLQLARCPEEAKCWIFIENANDIENIANQSLDLDEEAAYACHRLPIHRACANKPPVDIIVALLSAYPDAVMYREKYGMLPLHVACNKGASVEVIDTLISQYPQSVKEIDSFGLLPIHVACTEGASIEVIKKLLRAYPESAEEKDNSGMKPENYTSETFHPNKSEVLKALRRVPAYWAAKAYVSGQVGVPLYSLLKTKEWSAANLFLNEKPESAGIWVMDDSSSWSDGYPCTPLHVACSNRAPDDLIKRLIKLYPESVNLRGGRYDMLPLHAACTHGVSLHSTKALIDASPSSVKETESFGLLPLHVAVYSLAKTEIVLALTSACPECINIEDLKGNTPKDYANMLFTPRRKEFLEIFESYSNGCSFTTLRDTPIINEELKIVNAATSLKFLIEQKNWGDIPGFLDVRPEECHAICVGNENDRNYAQFPIHEVCAMKPPSTVIKAFIKAYPPAVQSRTAFNEYPLHIACKSGASFGVVYSLLKAFKGAVSFTNSEGRSPLHLTAMAGTDPSVLELILKASPGAVNVRDSNGYTPQEYLEESHHRNKVFLIDVIERYKSRVWGTSAVLYELVKSCKWEEIKNRLENHSSEAKVWIFDEGYGFGRLPLHLACALNPPLEIIKRLYKIHRKSVSIAEKDGRYPLHTACKHGASVQIVEFLIAAYPDALSLEDNFGLLPIHFACSEGASMDVVKLLLRSAPNSIFQKDGRGWTPLDYSELTRTDYESIVTSISPGFVPQLVRCNSLPSKIDVETFLEEKHQDSEIVQKNDKNHNIREEHKERDPMSRREKYESFGISKSATVLHDIQIGSKHVQPLVDVKSYKGSSSSELV